METRTQTPWQINGSHVYGADPSRELICQVVSLNADRHLIAAAPALYEALADIMTGWIVPSGSAGRAFRARAALALARGEHPESRVGLDPDAGTRSSPNQGEAK